MKRFFDTEEKGVRTYTDIRRTGINPKTSTRYIYLGDANCYYDRDSLLPDGTRRKANNLLRFWKGKKEFTVGGNIAVPYEVNGKTRYSHYNDNFEFCGDNGEIRFGFKKFEPITQSTFENL